MSRSSIKIAHLKIWFVWGLALFLPTLLPAVGYCYARVAAPPERRLFIGKLSSWHTQH
jgi:hypothetical protein